MTDEEALVAEVRFALRGLDPWPPKGRAVPSEDYARKVTFPVVGYVPDGPRIEALLVAERGASPRLVGRVEFRRPGVLDDDAREALRFLTRPKPCISIARPGRGVRWLNRG